MGHRYTYSVFIAAIVLLYGCTFRQTTYVNHLPHDPAFEKGGEAVGGASSGMYGTDVQAAFSPVSFVGLTAGAYHGWSNRFSYNYGALVYMPVARFKNHRLFLSFHYEATGAELRDEEGSRASYTGFNLRPSVYTSGNFDNLHIKTGLTYQLTEASYSRLFVNERSIEIGPFGIPIPVHTVRADAHNIKFNGYGFYWFMEVTDKKSPLSGCINLGVMPGKYNYLTVGSDPVQNQEFRHRISSFYTVSVKYRLKLY